MSCVAFLFLLDHSFVLAALTRGRNSRSTYKIDSCKNVSLVQIIDDYSTVLQCDVCLSCSGNLGFNRVTFERNSDGWLG